MNHIPGAHDYIELVRTTALACGSSENMLEARTPHETKPVALWLNGTSQETHDLDEVLALASRDAATSRKAVCIVGNISWDWIGSIGVKWKIEPQFFSQYGANPQGEDPWSTLFSQSLERGATQSASKHHHMDGVFEHQHLKRQQTTMDLLNTDPGRSPCRRRYWVPTDPLHSLSSSTRISYCRIDVNLCMAVNSLF